MPYKDVERQKRAKRESARRRRRQRRLEEAAAKAAARSDGGAEERPVRAVTAESVLGIVAAELDGILAHEPRDLARARVVATLASTLKGLLESVAIEQRIEQLERSRRHLEAVR